VGALHVSKASPVYLESPTPLEPAALAVAVEVLATLAAWASAALVQWRDCPPPAC
jgi:hypothetical protein